MKKIIVTFVLLIVFFFPTGVGASVKVDTALSNLYENIEIQYQDNDKRLKFLENLVKQIDKMKKKTSNTQALKLLSEMRPKINKQISYYKQEAIRQKEPYKVVNGLVGAQGYDFSLEGNTIKAHYINKSYSEVDSEDYLTVGYLTTKSKNSRLTTDIKLQVDFNGANRTLFSRLFLKSSSGNIYSSTDSYNSGGYRYYSFDNISSNESYIIYAQIAGMKKSRSTIEIYLSSINKGKISGSRDISKVKIRRIRNSGTPHTTYVDGHYSGGYSLGGLHTPSFSSGYNPPNLSSGNLNSGYNPPSLSDGNLNSGYNPPNLSSGNLDSGYNPPANLPDGNLDSGYNPPANLPDGRLDGGYTPPAHLPDGPNSTGYNPPNIGTGRLDGGYTPPAHIPDGPSSTGYTPPYIGSGSSGSGYHPPAHLPQGNNSGGYDYWFYEETTVEETIEYEIDITEYFY